MLNRLLSESQISRAKIFCRPFAFAFSKKKKKKRKKKERKNSLFLLQIIISYKYIFFVLFNGISTFVDILVHNPNLLKNNSDII